MTHWFARHREQWIAEMLHVYGFINRAHLMRKFLISRAQASADLRRFLQDHPDKIAYDQSRKCYVSKPR